MGACPGQDSPAVLDSAQAYCRCPAHTEKLLYMMGLRERQGFCIHHPFKAEQRLQNLHRLAQLFHMLASEKLIEINSVRCAQLPNMFLLLRHLP